MFSRQVPTGHALADDRIAQAMACMLWGAPLLLALALTGGFLAREAGARKTVTSAAVEMRQPIEKPIMTQAVVRPQRATPAAVAAISEASRENLIAMAFMPHVDSVVGANSSAIEAKPVSADLPTASANVGPAPQFNVRSAEARPWRAQTLKHVGVAQGLRLIAGGALLSLAGIEPMAQDAQCKRLDGVMEPCVSRAASRLEILTRGRTVTCQVFDAQSGEPTVARCKADKIDLADDLIKNGLARRA